MAYAKEWTKKKKKNCNANDNDTDDMSNNKRYKRSNPILKINIWQWNKWKEKEC